MGRRNTEVRLLLYHEFIFGGRYKNTLEKLTIYHYMLVILICVFFPKLVVLFFFSKF
jgi:hypothetical protein